MPNNLQQLAELLEVELPDLKGDTGERGADGKDGEKGEKGDKGEQGIPGKNGKDGKNGRDGIDGKDGKDGRDGKDGKDAVFNFPIEEKFEEIEKKIKENSSRVSTGPMGINEIIAGAGMTVNMNKRRYPVVTANLVPDGLSKITVGTTEPVAPSIGDLWIDTA
jgi:hypothetical protein